MKKIGILIFILALMVGVVFSSFFSFGKVETSNLIKFNFSRGVKGSGNVVTEQREVSDFTGIDVGGIFNVEATAGREYSHGSSGDGLAERPMQTIDKFGMSLVSEPIWISGSRSE